MKRPRAASTSLYARLGGYDRMVRVLDGVSGRLMRDERFQVYFRGHSDTSKQRLKHRFIDFICAEAGGPVLYTGETLTKAHAGLRIARADFQAFEDVVRDAAKANKLSPAETKALSDFISTFMKDVVEEKPAKRYRQS